jgi:hypothetical protein
MLNTEHTVKVLLVILVLPSSHCGVLGLNERAGNPPIAFCVKVIAEFAVAFDPNPLLSFHDDTVAPPPVAPISAASSHKTHPGILRGSNFQMLLELDGANAITFSEQNIVRVRSAARVDGQ